jgi:hypothetical protein
MYHLIILSQIMLERKGGVSRIWVNPSPSPHGATNPFITPSFLRLTHGKKLDMSDV